MQDVITIILIIMTVMPGLEFYFFNKHSSTLDASAFRFSKEPFGTLKSPRLPKSTLGCPKVPLSTLEYPAIP